MPQSARVVVEDAYSLIGTKGQGKSLSAEDINLGFRFLTDMLAQLTIQRLTIPVLTKVTGLSLTAGVTEYTVGTGLDLNTPVPVSIEELILVSGGARYKLDSERLTNMVEAESVSARPTRYFYQTGQLLVAQVPNLAYPIEMWVKRAVTSPAVLDDNMGFDDAYIPMFKYNLAVGVAPLFGRSVSAEIAKLATDYKFFVECAAYKNEPLKSELPNGEFRRIEETG